MRKIKQKCFGVSNDYDFDYFKEKLISFEDIFCT